MRGRRRSRWLVIAALALGRTAASQEPAAPDASEAPDAPGVLERATESLDRFQSVEAAERAGYRKPWHNDGFMMGEHWYQSDLLRGSACDPEKPAFLQYLVIEGQRTLVGAGYVCDGARPPPDWFGPEAVWHRHGPELCRFRSGVFSDARFYAAALPNPLNDETWQDICDSWWAEPEQREVVMLHTWNWIAQPDGPFASENRAIPFLRAGLRVPTREQLDEPSGRAALDTLRLAYGDIGRRYEAAFRVADLGRFDAWGARRVLRHGQRRANQAVERMQTADKLGDRNLWASAARDGAAALADLQTEIAERLAPDARAIVDRFLASLMVGGHHTDDSAE